MIAEVLKSLFGRDLIKLKNEIEAYRHESRLWVYDKQILNSGGNLCLHLIGNLNAYIGVGLAKTAYVRKRDLEFSQKNLPKAELIKMIDETIIVVATGLNNLTENDLTADFPIVIWEDKTNMGYTLTHLLTHLNYHLGQINYHRRLLDQ